MSMIRSRSLCYTSPTPSVVALGCFDGVHLGHRAVLQKARALADQKGLPCLVWTFRQPPKNFFAPGSVPLLTDENEKADHIGALGADVLVSVDFDRAVASLSAEQFMEDILCDRLKAACVVCGFNYSFGKGGRGNQALLREFCDGRGIDLCVTDPVLLGDTPVSSSLIRAAIAQGEMEKAAALLGRPYRLTAPVVDGQKLARNLGFPTLNQVPDPSLAIPRFGVYVAQITGAEDTPRFGITNVGMRPTVKGRLLCAETHIFDFSGDLYGKTLTVELLHFLRPETEFASLEALRSGVLADMAEARRYLAERQA